VDETPTPKKFGLKAPPKNSQHVLDNMRNLNKKLRMGEEEEKQDQDKGDLMDMLMGIDFNQTEA
jgi:hypothetical protein